MRSVMLKKTISLFIFILTITASLTIAELKVPKLTSRVVDRTGMLSAQDNRQIETVIKQFEAATKGQMAVLIIPSLKGDSLELYSMRVAEEWKIGYKGQDNGLLLLISKNDHKMRLEVGYGFEGNINDARAGDIIRGIGPYFRAGRFADGINFAVLRSQEIITGNKAAIPPPPPRQLINKKTKAISPFFIFLIIYIIISIFGRRRGFFLYAGGLGRSGFGGGFGGGGGFSGGGGSFGGGGASGGW